MSDNLQQLGFAHVHSKLFLCILQKEFQDLKAQLTSAAEKEQDYLKQLVTLKTDLEQEGYDHFENIILNSFGVIYKLL